jgi:hypothetical protein
MAESPGTVTKALAIADAEIYRASIERAGAILNRTNARIRRWLRRGELTGLQYVDIETAIESNLAGHTICGQRLARERLAEAMGEQPGRLRSQREGGD